MSYSSPVAPVTPAPPDHPLSSRNHGRGLRVGLAALAIALAVAVGYLVHFVSGTGGPAAALVLDQADAVLWGQTVNRRIEVAANNVTIRRVTVRTGGAAAILIRSGVVGTTIEDTQINCTSRNTDGIAPGGYTAVRVRVNGCREAFQQTLAAPATVRDSARDGEPATIAGDTATPATPPPPATLPDTPSGPPVGPAAVPPTPITYWPSASNTGVPVGTALRSSGSLALKTAGQIVTGLNIVGCVTVAAANVQILRSKITCSSPTYAIRTLTGTKNLLIQDVEINSTATNSATVCCSEYTIRRANIYNMIDGPRLGSNTTVVDSYLHNLKRVVGSHNDIMQSTGGTNIKVLHNTLLAYDPVTNDPFNSCLTIGTETAPLLSNLLFENNYCNGGNYSIGINPKTVASNCVFRVNKYGRNYRYGVVARWDLPGIIWDKPTNVWFDTGLPVIR